MCEKIQYKTQNPKSTIVVDITFNDIGLPNIIDQWVFIGEEEVKAGDIITLSSCDIPYHNVVLDSWTTKTSEYDRKARIVAELVNYNDENYQWNKSRNGGCYLDSFYKILEVKEVVPME